MAFMYQIYRDEKGVGMTLIFSDGVPQTLAYDHVNFDRIERLIREAEAEGIETIDEDYLRELLVPAKQAGLKLAQLSERVRYDGHGSILFDGDPFTGAIADHIVRIIQEGGTVESYIALVRFMEKISMNPSEASRNSLYDFIVRHNITIDPDGDFYVYKGVRSDGKSIHSGFGIVNGVTVEGHLANEPGSVIEMPRSMVDSNTGVGCSTGLHAGTYSYANSFSQGKLLMVKVNPRDVVSVPDHCSYQKIRTSRYKVITTTDVEVTSTTHSFSGDGENNVDNLQDIIDDFGEGEVSFTYSRGDGSIVDVDATITEIADTQDGETLLITKTGATYRYEFISDFTIHFEDEDEDDDDSDIMLDYGSGVGEFSAGDRITVEQLVELVEQYNPTVNFSYTTVGGEARTLQDFVVTHVRDTRNAQLVCGTRDDGEERNYRADRISDVEFVSY